MPNLKYSTKYPTKTPQDTGNVDLVDKARIYPGYPKPTAMKMQTTQTQQRVINNSRYEGAGRDQGGKPQFHPQSTSRFQYNDLPKLQYRSFKKGGVIPKTGTYNLHKAEVVIPGKKFTNEHKHLVKVLKEGSKAEQKKEGKEQAKEMQEVMKKTHKKWMLSDSGAMKG